ncbi:hypothetical protein KXX06_006792, partial [Aspergillus fumigatus]
LPGRPYHSQFQPLNRTTALIDSSLRFLFLTPIICNYRDPYPYTTGVAFSSSFASINLMADQLFERIPPLRVMICRQCRYGVWPGKAKRHLKRQHQLNCTTVARLVHKIQQWTDVAAHAQAVQIPHALDEPLPILPSYSQGILCRRDPAT